MAKNTRKRRAEELLRILRDGPAISTLRRSLRTFRGWLETGSRRDRFVLERSIAVIRDLIEQEAKFER